MNSTVNPTNVSKPDDPNFGAQSVNVEGKDLLLQTDRICELALECWNLRKERFAKDTKTKELNATIERLKTTLKSSVELTGELERRNLRKESEMESLRCVISDIKQKLLDAEGAKRYYSATLTKMKRALAEAESAEKERFAYTKSNDVLKAQNNNIV